MRETALILGAGSSKTFGLPLGSELRDKIAHDLELKFDDRRRGLISGSHKIVEALRLLMRTPEGRTGDINPHRAAAVEISDAMPLSSSIDEYIERHRDDGKKATCAKLAIAKVVLEAERASSIFSKEFHQRDGVLGGASKSWLASFLRDITRGFGPNDVSEAFRNLTVVNFNYDRCLEHFAYNWLQDVYRLQPEQAAAIVRDICIYHPYGRIAPLDWECRSSGVNYGASLDVRRLIQMAESIRTYSEAFEPDSGLSEIKERLKNVDSVVFLGFGFHKQNMELLSIESELNRGSLKCFATRSGISNPRWEIMKQRVSNAFAVPGHRDLHDHSISADCEEFWDEYSDVILN